MVKSIQDILEKLQSLNKLPVKDVRGVLNLMRPLLEYPLKYDELNYKFFNLIKAIQFGEFWMIAATVEEDFPNEDEKTLLEIQKESEDLLIKYNPVKGVKEIVKRQLSDLGSVKSLSKDYKKEIETMKNRVERLRQVCTYISYVKRKSTDFMKQENVLLSKMQKSADYANLFLGVYDKNFSELLDYIGSNSTWLTRERFLEDVKKELTKGYKVNGFSLDNEGNLKVEDEHWAKVRLIKLAYKDAKDEEEPKALAEESDKYYSLGRKLPEKDLNDCNIKIKEMLDLMDDNGFNPQKAEVLMLNHPREIENLLSVFSIMGIDMDWQKIQDGWIEELRNPGNDEKKKKIREALSVRGYDVAHGNDFKPEASGGQGVFQEESLSSLPLEELFKIWKANETLIKDNNMTIKKKLVQRILEQQSEIDEQEKELLEVNKLTGLREKN